MINQQILTLNSILISLPFLLSFPLFDLVCLSSPKISLKQAKKSLYGSNWGSGGGDSAESER